MKLLARIACAVALAGAASGSWAATLKIATVAPDGTAWMREMRAAGEAVKAKTAGRVEVKFYPGGVMGDHATVLRKMKLGQLQGGAFTGGEATVFVKDAQVYSLPFLFRDEAEIAAVRGRLDPLLREEFAKAGYELLGISGGGFAYLMSTHDIQSPEALKAAKVWVPQGDRIAEIAFKTAGVAPIPLPLADVYTSLQTGLVDTAANTTAGAIAFQWHTRLKYVVDQPLSFVVGELVLDRKPIDRLEAADREILRAEFGAAFARLEQVNRNDNVAARKALEQQGIVFAAPSAEERARFEAIGAQVFEQLVGAGEVSSPMLAALEAALAEARSGK